MASAGIWNRAFGSPPPAWLASDAPDVDVCLSSRVRLMRNLAGYRFPHRASRVELREIADAAAGVGERSGLSVVRGISPAERDALLAGRLISPEFPAEAPGRAVLLDEDRRISILVNEEDHLRFQSLTGGTSLGAALRSLEAAFQPFDEGLAFAWSPRFGYLSSSPYNCGTGVRMSAMFHLAALANARRLPRVLRALQAMGVASRGLFGESSKAVGAFVQISVTEPDPTPLQAAAEVLLQEERAERGRTPSGDLARNVERAIGFGIASRTASLADALRVLAWLRWGADASLPGCPASPRIVDAWLARMDPRSGEEPAEAARGRARTLRAWIESGT